MTIRQIDTKTLDLVKKAAHSWFVFPHIGRHVSHCIYTTSKFVHQAGLSPFLTRKSFAVRAIARVMPRHGDQEFEIRIGGEGIYIPCSYDDNSNCLNQASWEILFPFSKSGPVTKNGNKAFAATKPGEDP